LAYIPAVPSPRHLLALLLVPLVLTLAACGGDEEESAGTAGGAATTGTAPAAADCAPGSLELTRPGRLTVGTDKPAFPPYFEDDDPTNGRGFESAVAYAVARELGFRREQVTWTTVPFNSSYAPGPKDFDFDINQISITPQRARRVDFSEPYFTAPQAVIAKEDSPIANARTLAEVGRGRLGVQVGTTSLDAAQERIRPQQQPQVFNDSNDVVRALDQGSVDGAVVDLPTAFYLTAAELEGAKIVGRFQAPGGDDWGLLLERGSSLTACVNQALARVRESGELRRLEQRYMGGQAAPELR
jgi:polar amino acid transport system substrate-binding protein